jgi:hypothetical protein
VPISSIISIAHIYLPLTIRSPLQLEPRRAATALEKRHPRLRWLHHRKTFSGLGGSVGRERNMFDSKIRALIDPLLARPGQCGKRCRRGRDHYWWMRTGNCGRACRRVRTICHRADPTHCEPHRRRPRRCCCAYNAAHRSRSRHADARKQSPP